MKSAQHPTTIIVTQALSLLNCPVFGDEGETGTNIRDGLGVPLTHQSLSVPTLFIIKLNKPLLESQTYDDTDLADECGFPS